MLQKSQFWNTKLHVIKLIDKSIKSHFRESKASNHLTLFIEIQKWDETEQSYKSEWKQISERISFSTHHLRSVCLGWHFLSLWHITDSNTSCYNGNDRMFGKQHKTGRALILANTLERHHLLKIIRLITSVCVCACRSKHHCILQIDYVFDWVT